MNAPKFFISSMAAASVVGMIGLAYAQTSPNPAGPTTSPGMQETNPPLTSTPSASTMPNTTNNGTTGTSADGSVMTDARAARTDRN